VSALSYLSSQRYVIHRAVAADNFLVAADDRLVKLTGFERARRVTDDDYLVCLLPRVGIAGGGFGTLGKGLTVSGSNISWAICNTINRRLFLSENRFKMSIPVQNSEHFDI